MSNCGVTATTTVRRRTTQRVSTQHGQRGRVRAPSADSAPLANRAMAMDVLDSRPLPKVPQRLPSTVNKRETLAGIAERIPIAVMRRFFDYSLRTAAEAMGISVTTLKRLCRRHGVKRWPHRQIRGINRTLSDLEEQRMCARDEEAAEAVAVQLRQLQRRREAIIELAFESDDDDCRRSSCASVSSDSNSDPIARKRRSSTFNGNPDGDSGSSASSATMVLGLAPPSPGAAPKSPGSSMAFNDRIPASVRKFAATSEGEEGSSGGGSDVAFLLGSSASMFSSPSPLRKTNRSSAMFGRVLGLEKWVGERQKTGQQHFVTPANTASEGNMPTSGRGSASSFAKPPSANDFRNDHGKLDFPRGAAFGSGALVPRTVHSTDNIDSSSVAKGRMRSSLLHEGLTVADSSGVRIPSTSAASARYMVDQAAQETDQFSALDELLFEPDEAAAADHDVRGNWENFDRNTDATGLAAVGNGYGGGDEGSNSRGGPRTSYGDGEGLVHNTYGADISAISVHHEQALVGTPIWEQPCEVDGGFPPTWDGMGVGTDRDGWATSASFVL